MVAPQLHDILRLSAWGTGVRIHQHICTTGRWTVNRFDAIVEFLVLPGVCELLHFLALFVPPVILDAANAFS